MARAACTCSLPDSHIDNGKIVGDPYIRMEGRLVFKAAVEKMTESALNVLAAANLAPGDVDVYIPHQANLRIMNMVRGKLNIPESNLVVSVTKHGNHVSGKCSACAR